MNRTLVAHQTLKFQATGQAKIIIYERHILNKQHWRHAQAHSCPGQVSASLLNRKKGGRRERNRNTGSCCSFNYKKNVLSKTLVSSEQ